MLDFIFEQGSKATHLTSVCTGALLLGAAGLLRGRRATTHWATHALLPIFGVIPVSERVVTDGNCTTSAGVTAGMDMALTLVARLRDPIYAQGMQLGAEYAPKPPFHSGTPAEAPPEVLAIITGMYSGFVREFGQTAQQVIGQGVRGLK